MNYGVKGVVSKRKSLESKFIRYKKMISISFINIIILCVISVGVIGVSLGIGVFTGIVESAPDLSTLSILPTGYSTLVYDAEGNEVAKLVSEDSNRRYRTMDQIPENLANAFVAIEDERFYEHNGIDLKGILRAAISTFESGSLGQGASTITQQLLKNNVFEDWVNEKDGQKIKRKIQEQSLAIELEKLMTKEEILEIYMNTINLGQGTLGVEAAALRYFNKSAYDLTLSECATIAAITQNPSGYNPISYPESNAIRRQKVLDNMLEMEYITQTEYNVAIADDVYERIQLINQEIGASSAYTYFVDALIEQVLEDFKTELGYNDTQAYNALYSGGLSIFTTQDPAIQTIANDVYSNEDNYPSNPEWYLNYELTIQKSNGDLENHSTEMYKEYYKQLSSKFNLLYNSQDEAYEAIEAYKEEFVLASDVIIGETISLTPQPQVSLTIQNQSTGHIVAMIGGRGVKEASRTLNRATNVMRSPGSTFKVLGAFAPALDSAGKTLATTYNDAPFNYSTGTPVSNWYSQYKGLSSIRLAIEQSMNIIAVKTATNISPQLAYDYLVNFGFTTLVVSQEINGTIYSDITQSLALGGLTKGATNLELNAAYAAIANQGTYIKPTLYTKIIDHEGNVLIDKSEPETRQVLKETTAFLLTDAMVDVVTKGTATSVNFGGMSIAGKTGTSSKNVDVWFAGFTPYYTATTWTGFDNNEYLSGSETSLSKSLWRAVMSEIHNELPNKAFERPSGIVTATVCSKSGYLPVAGLCDGHLKTEYFADGTVPKVSCNVHYQGAICHYTGQPAHEFCPLKGVATLELIPPENLTGYSNSEEETTMFLCPHDALFFADPNYEAIIEMQHQEIIQRGIDAQLAAEAAAAAALGQ
ncbi:MAG: transglycosylase domain-containing protein [Eubacteriales bacterium]